MYNISTAAAKVLWGQRLTPVAEHKAAHDVLAAQATLPMQVHPMRW